MSLMNLGINRNQMDTFCLEEDSTKNISKPDQTKSEFKRAFL